MNKTLKSRPETHSCHVCKQIFPRQALHPWEAMRNGISALIEADAPGWEQGCYICNRDAAHFRRLYVERILQEEKGQLSKLDHDVLKSLEAGTLVSHLPDEVSEGDASFGARMADQVAKFGGSWPFILSFLGVLLVWIAFNVSGLLRQPFDPYPFILLNLVLSCLAAVQAPIIMMSQSRQEVKDRQRAENDYRVNLKAELEIRQLHEKIDHQLVHQWQRLVEMQQIQIEMLEEKLQPLEDQGRRAAKKSPAGK